MDNLLQTAIQYSQLGLSVIATDAWKRSIVKWAAYQQKLATVQQLTDMFRSPRASCIAAITGCISQNLEVIDIDSKYDLKGRLFERLMAEIQKRDHELIKKLVLVQSQSGGYHLYYRCAVISRGQTLARRATSIEEIAQHSKATARVLIETRGEGGYIIVPPSPGYAFIQNDCTNIPIISIEQRNILLESARLFNEIKKNIVIQPRSATLKQDILSPLDDYNQRGDVVALVEHHGWKKVHTTSIRTLFLRPGDTNQQSSGDYNHDMRLFSVFSTSTAFKPGKGYSPCAVYAVLECGGNFKEAAKSLAAKGYGYSSLVRNPSRGRQL